jgi:alkylated DNA repair dioxygenase AlkB
MDLFSDNQITNLLPYDGTVFYYGTVIPQAEANHYFNQLYNTIEWRNDEAIVFGKHFITARKVAWYGTEEYNYSYSNTTKKALPWTNELLALKALAEQTTKATYNSCLLNLYHNGSEGMSWHSDAEKMLQKEGSIASFTFGAERKFAFKHKLTKDTTSIVLQDGSLLEMKNNTQTHWLHRLPPSRLIKTPRINLTFRTIVV